MPRTIRFHLDENCHRAVAEGLRRRGVDVTTTPETGLLQATDEQQLAHCLREVRVFFTRIEISFASMLRVPRMLVSPTARRIRKQSAR